MSDGQQVPAAALGKAILSFVVFLIVLGVAMFLPAGDIRWAKGWLFLLFFLVLTIPGVVYLWRTNPEILAARSKMTRAGTKRWDKVLMVFLLLSFVAVFSVAGFDAGRFHWSNVSLWLIVLGYVLQCVGFFISIWVYRVNKFAEPSVRIQTERGHKVIDTGPYAIIRHPLYLAGLLMSAGIPLALASFWAFVPTAVATSIIVLRTILEDRMLQKELAGYKDYTRRVPHRLIPGVW